MKRIGTLAKRFIKLTSLAIALLMSVTAWAQDGYSPDKVVYDISSPETEVLSHMLDRASLLQRLYQNDSFNAAIVFVIHEGAVPLFAKHDGRHDDLMRRANSLTHGEMIQFRLCLASAKMQGFKKTDFHDFVEIVPMADAELIKLQHNGYAYLR